MNTAGKDSDCLPKVHAETLPFFNPSTYSVRGYVNIKSHTKEGNEMEIEEFPNWLLEIPLNVHENENYVLVCSKKESNHNDHNRFDSTLVYNLAHSSTTALTSQSFELHFSDNTSLLVWTASNMTTMSWLHIFDSVITVANERDVTMQHRMQHYKVDEYIDTLDV